MPATPKRHPYHILTILLLWLVFYATFTLFTPPLLDDADSVHAEVAREMLLRNDWVTLYANGIRYLEKAPLLYWSMAASFKLFGSHTPSARLPLAFTVLALALLVESFARRSFDSARSGLYAALIVLSSFGIFIFTRITIPDAMVCLWLTLAIYAYFLSEQHHVTSVPRWLSYTFASACALNVLTKGLIGIVFPIAIIVAHLFLTRGPRKTLTRLRQLHPVASTLVFFAIAAPWHIFIGLANPAQGTPGHLTFINHHWQVPQPTQGNVHGWTWFYFVNEHLLRYLNLRVPRDYDTVPLALFWGLLFIWLMPWSAFLPNALASIPALKVFRRKALSPHESTLLLIGLWVAIPMLFFSLSTRQEYYVLPTLPAFALLIAFWLTEEAAEAFPLPNLRVTAGQRISIVLLILGSVAALAAAFLALHAHPPGANTDLASLLQQNPGDYALSFGHFLDLNAQAMGAFRDPLVLTALALFTGTFASWFYRRNHKPHVANLWLAAATFVFLIAAHLGLQIFSPVLSSRSLASALAPSLRPNDLIIINGEYESASTLGFYLHRPGPDTEPIHILNGRSSNLWYGSFFPDAPAIFEDNASVRQKWSDNRRIFLWQDLSTPLPPLLGKTYLITQSGGKEILSNQPNLF